MVSAELSDLLEPENTYERERWTRLLEVYTPVRQQDANGRVLAVVEFYQAPDDVDREVAAARLQSWGAVAAVTVAPRATDLAAMCRSASGATGRH